MKKKQKLIFIFLMCAVNLSAQVTIGALEEPHAAAILDLSKVPSHNLGLLLPRAKLQKLNEFLPLTGDEEKATGMVVYNEAQVKDEVYPGTYFWDGEKWGRIGCIPATITDYPSGKTVTTTVGASVTLGISVADSPGLTYQWHEALGNDYTGGAPISSATNASYSPFTLTEDTYYYYCVVTSSCYASTDTSDVFTVNVINPATLPTDCLSGTLTGRTAFDVAETVEDSCGTFVIRRAVDKVYAKFEEESTYKQTYTFTPTGTVSNVRFAYVETSGSGIVTSLTADADYSGDISTACTATLLYDTDLNNRVAGKTRSEAFKVDIYAIYESEGRDDCAEKLTAWIQDCAFSGAYTTTGAWLVFMPYNLGANPNYATPETQMAYTPDPDTNVSTDTTVYGALYQWGRLKDGHEKRDSDIQAGPVTTSTPGDKFVTNENKDVDIVYYFNWYTGSNPTRNSLWTETKGVHDPCPDGYKVPTEAQLRSIFNNITAGNYATLSGHGNNWSRKSTATKGIHSGGTLFLPAAGNRNRTNGNLYYAGSNGYYWSSSLDLGYSPGLQLLSSYASVFPSTTRSTGYSVRCVAISSQ